MPCSITSLVNKSLAALHSLTICGTQHLKHCFLNVCAFSIQLFKNFFYYVRSSRGLCCKILDFVHPHVQLDHQIFHRDGFNVGQQLHGNESQASICALFSHSPVNPTNHLFALTSTSTYSPVHFKPFKTT